MSDEYTPTDAPTTYQIRMMLRDDEQLSFINWLSAVETAVRADERKLQAEKDIAIVERLYPLGSQVLGNAPTVIAVAIRTQFVEQEAGKA